MRTVVKLQLNANKTRTLFSIHTHSQHKYAQVYYQTTRITHVTQIQGLGASTVAITNVKWHAAAGCNTTNTTLALHKLKTTKFLQKNKNTKCIHTDTTAASIAQSSNVL